MSASIYFSEIDTELTKCFSGIQSNLETEEATATSTMDGFQDSFSWDLHFAQIDKQVQVSQSIVILKHMQAMNATQVHITYHLP